MQKLSEEKINEIRSKADIVDVVSDYLAVEKKGKDFKAICPFHDDHDPSLSISQDRQIYKCFVCGAGGNVFGFVSKIDNISFVEAVVKVADKVHVDLDGFKPERKPEDMKLKPLYDVMNEAMNYFHYQLGTQAGIEYHSFCEKRGLTQGICNQFQLGVCVDDHQMSEFLQAKGYDGALLVQTDLSRIQETSLKDVFYRRLIFPILDRDGRCIAFSARTIDTNNDVKYINTSQTPLYTKGQHLYNMHQAKPIATKDNQIIVCEGVTDVIAYARAGINNAVATLGTSCTAEQMNLIKQCSWNVVLSYDGDQAGLEANYKLGKQLIEMKCQVEVCYNLGLDPDEVIKQSGTEGLQTMLANRLPWLEFVIQYATYRYGNETYQNRKSIVDFVVEHLRNLAEFDRNYFAGRLADISGFGKEDILKLIEQNQVKTEKRFDRLRKVYKSKNPEPLAYLEILNQMNLSKAQAYTFRNELGFLPSPAAEDCALLYLDAYQRADEVYIADLLSKDLEPGLRDILLYLSSGFFVQDVNPLILEENITLVKVYMVDLQIKLLMQRAAQETDPVKKGEIGREISQQQRKKQQLLRRRS